MADEQRSPRVSRLSPVIAGQLGNLVEPQEILPHRGAVVPEIL